MRHTAGVGLHPQANNLQAGLEMVKGATLSHLKSLTVDPVALKPITSGTAPDVFYSLWKKS